MNVAIPEEFPPLRLVSPADDSEPVEIPPHDLDAEASVLSGILLDADSVMPKIESFLRPEHFYANAHRRIYEAALALWQAKTPVDTTTVIVRLRDTGRLSEVGDGATVTELLSASPAVSNVMAHALPVYDLARVRTALRASQEFVARCYLRDLGEGVQPFLDGAARTFSTIARRSAVSRVESNAETLKRVIRAIAELVKAGNPEKAGLPTGLGKFDVLTRGLHAGEKTLIVALPKVGKTALALQIAVTVAKRGVGVLYLSQEVPREQCLTRILACEANVDADNLRTGMLSKEEWARVVGAIGEIEKLPLWIDDTPDMNADKVCSTVTAYVDRARAERTVPLGLFVVDYIQRLERCAGEERLPKHEFIGNASKKMTNLARTLQIACIELAQRKPAPIDKATKTRPEPVSGETCDSSGIEREAHAVVYLFRNPRYAGGGHVIGEDATRLTLRLALQRAGAEGDTQLEYDGSRYRFTAIDTGDDEDRYR